MLFNSFKFLFFFLPFVLWLSSRARGQLLIFIIVASSLVFYAFAGHAWFVLPMLFTTTMDFFLAQKIEATPDYAVKKRLLTFSILVNLSLLAWFKYSGMLLHSTQAVAALFGLHVDDAWYKALNVVLPSGISFYTFQTIAYMLDVYAGNCAAEKKYLRLLGFISFFPHLIAGPITRHHQLIPQLESIEKTGTRPSWKPGVYLFVIGLSKKVLIADRIGSFIDPMLASPAHLDFISAWAAMLGYGMQLYFDFSGYTDMAIGLGRLFGVELPQNFDRPFQSKNPAEYWQRWHITLSKWLTSYLYTPIAMMGGDSRTAKWRPHFNIIATMLIAGIWHGANWTFAVYGLFHGILIASYHMMKTRWNRMPAKLQVLLTFFLVTLSWVFFRAHDTELVGKWYGAAFGANGIELSHLVEFTKNLFLPLLAFALILVFTGTNASQRNQEFNELPRRYEFGLGLMFAATLLMMNYSSKFLYYQF